jgi:hypothetical protein
LRLHDCSKIENPERPFVSDRTFRGCRSIGSVRQFLNHPYRIEEAGNYEYVARSRLACLEFIDGRVSVEFVVNS